MRRITAFINRESSINRSTNAWQAAGVAHLEASTTPITDFHVISDTQRLPLEQ
jgi:hypothetical protein